MVKNWKWWFWFCQYDGSPQKDVKSKQGCNNKELRRNSCVGRPQLFLAHVELSLQTQRVQFFGMPTTLYLCGFLTSRGAAAFFGLKPCGLHLCGVACHTTNQLHASVVLWSAATKRFYFGIAVVKGCPVPFFEGHLHAKFSPILLQHTLLRASSESEDLD